MVCSLCLLRGFIPNTQNCILVFRIWISEWSWSGPHANLKEFRIKGWLCKNDCYYSYYCNSVLGMNSDWWQDDELFRSWSFSEPQIEGNKLTTTTLWNCNYSQRWQRGTCVSSQWAGQLVSCRQLPAPSMEGHQVLRGYKWAIIGAPSESTKQKG